MAEQRIRPTAENGRHPHAPLIDAPPPNRIDAAIDRMQALRPNTPVDCMSAEPELAQLESSDDSMLPIGQLGNRRIPTHAPFVVYMRPNGAWAVHRPIVAVVK
jgi:hypothetical protein